VIFEEALAHEQISFSGDLADTEAKVHLINTKGGGKLNVSLGGDLIDAYVGNNPFPSIAVEKKIGKVVCDLEELPPGTFRNHPCCCIAANMDAIEGKDKAVAGLLTLFMQANETINGDLDTAVASASRWIGTSEAVERMSIPTSGYSLEVTEEWEATIDKWIEAMNRLGAFTGSLKDAPGPEAREKALDMSLLSKAKERLE
jgi:NitT/TauT family transport system substrate-binding protein